MLAIKTGNNNFAVMHPYARVNAWLQKMVTIFAETPLERSRQPYFMLHCDAACFFDKKMRFVWHVLELFFRQYKQFLDAFLCILFG